MSPVSSTTPPSGKVLVVGFGQLGPQIHKFGSRLHYCDASEIIRPSDLPAGIFKVSIYQHINRSDIQRIKAIADEKRIPYRVDNSSMSLLKTLQGWLGHPNSPSGNGQASPSVPPASLARIPEPPPAFPSVEALVLAGRSPVIRRQELNLPAPDAGEVAIPDGQFWIRVDETEPDQENPQPREWFDPEEMAIFAAGLAEFGQQNPIWAKRLETPIGKIKYQIIDGERRWRACIVNGTSHVLAVFKRPKNKFEQLQQQAIANFGRASHPIIEIAKMIERLCQMPELVQLPHTVQMQKLTGVFCQSVTWVTYHHSILNLHPDIQAKLNPALPKKQQMKGQMAVYLATIPDHPTQLRVAKEVDARGLSVKQARNFARQMAAKEGVIVGSPRRAPSDDFRPFVTFLRRLKEDVDIYNEMPEQNFRAMFQSRSADDVQKILDVIQVQAEGLNKIHARLKRLIPKS